MKTLPSSSALLTEIDVECADCQVVSGLMPLLKMCRPGLEIVLELTRDWYESNGRSPDDLIGVFRQAGFYYQIENDYSGLSNLSKEAPSLPKRVGQLSSLEQADLIFSHVDARELSFRPKVFPRVPDHSEGHPQATAFDIVMRDDLRIGVRFKCWSV